LSVGIWYAGNHLRGVFGSNKQKACFLLDVLEALARQAKGFAIQPPPTGGEIGLTTLCEFSVFPNKL
jgi:hypothetical protein